MKTEIRIWLSEVSLTTCNAMDYKHKGPLVPI